MKSDPPTPPVRLPVDRLALLGLRDGADGCDWARIRGSQLSTGGHFAMPLLAANALCAGVLVALLSGQVPLWQLLAWASAVAAAALVVAFRRLSSGNRTLVTATLGMVRGTALDGLLLALVWSLMPLVFAGQARGDAALGLWMTLVILMTASTVAIVSLPLAGIAFLATLGSSMALSLALSGHPSLALAALVFAALLGVICVGRARALILVRAQDLALAERDETVSLLLREFEESTADWLWEIDAQRRIVRASARFGLTLGREPAQLDGLPLLQVLAGTDWESGNVAPTLRTLADKLKAREAFRDLLVQVDIAGEKRWWQLAANPRHDEGGAFVGFRGVGSDVTEARQSTDRIARMARYDTLTGLPNRLLINEALGHAMSEADKWGSRCAFMMIDLDRFKAVNDTLGHPVGDRLLGRVSERLREMMTDNEIIGRLGGDEFAVVVRDARDTERLETLARTIIAKLSRPYEVDQHTLYIGASVGLAVGPRDGRTAEMLVRSADLALYRSKDAGGGVFHSYEPQLHVAAEERRILEIALRSALQNDELHLNFQPVVDTAAGSLTGFEALLRWTHPDFGPVSPSKFIPLAEDARLIAPIGEWVLRRACAEAAHWDESIRIAVNVSSEQLHNPAFVSVVAQALGQSGLRPERLELEVTESVFLREGTGAVRVLEQILELGCRLSLDDFGTGYSSLGYLSRTRFSTIKIDRSFVQAAANGGREATAIIRAVVALADSLGMTTTAEGVETEDEHRVVGALGCGKAQGFYFGRPLPLNEARTLATNSKGGNSAAA
ncbi:putative bifunctional diguanylate cyclase/phosphodiesterase [Sphingomonas spermidinifaciens]|uniref:putative bifunctional diguanylate cyclase/phosphodiesterase n=1 Tax=Sphingomonas spermidinifaciens TaxID=1141889 RepID=UPI001FE6917E|nr:EAL domain-containing protein [Sphingomonas spermidinifaciens]